MHLSRARRAPTSKALHARHTSIEPLEARIAPAFTLTLSFDASVGVNSNSAGGTTTFTATASGANLSWLDIAIAMAGGSNVVVNTGSTGAEPGHIIDLASVNKTITNPAGTSLSFESGTGANLVGDIVLGKITLNGVNSSLRVDARHDVVLSGLGDASHLLANATLTAATGAITDTGKIFATNLSADASTGLGTAGVPFLTQVSNLVAKTATGGISINNTGALTVGFNAEPFQGVQVTGAAGNIQITSDATISVTRVGDFVSAPGNVTMIANGALSSIRTNGDGDTTAAIESRNQGLVTLTAGQDILLGGPADNNTGDVASFGGGNAAITLSAGRDILVSGGSRVMLGSGSTGAGINLSAGRNLSITGNGGPGGVSQIMTGGSAGSIGLTAAGLFAANVGLAGPALASSGGSITVSAADMSMSSALDAGAGIVTLQQASTVARNIDLGLGNAAGALGLTGAEINLISAGSLRIGRMDNPGNVSLTGQIAPTNTNSLLLRAGGSISDGTAGEQADVIITNLTLQAVNQIGNSAADRLDFDVTALGASTTTSGGQRIFLRDTAGGVTIGSIGTIDGSGGSSGVFLTATNGSITSSAVDNVPEIVGSAVTIDVTGAGKIGADASNPLEVNATVSLSASSGLLTGNDIFLRDTAGGANIGKVNAGAGNVVLSGVNGSINSVTFEPSPVADVLGNTVTINVTGGASQIGTGNTALQVQATTLNASSAGGDIALQQATGSVAIGQVNAGAGNVTLLSAGGPITSLTPNDGVPEAIGNVVTLTVTAPSNGNTGQIGFFATTAQFFEVNANTLNASTNNSRLWIRDVGAGATAGLAIGSVNAGTNTAFLQVANGGNLTSASVDGVPDIIADTVNLRTLNGGSIGLSNASALEINATNLNAAVQLAAGGIYTKDTTGGLNVTLAQTVNGDVEVETEGAGANLAVTSIIVPAGTVTLRSSGTVNDTGSVATVTTPVLTILAGTGIGTTSALEIDVTSLRATVQQAGNINVKDTLDGFDATLVQTFDGDITLSAAGVTANLTPAIITAPGHTVTLLASTAVNGSGAGVNVVTANTLAITAGTGIGTINPLEIDTANFSAVVLGTGDIRVKDTANGLNVSSAQTSNGDIHFETAGAAADLTLANVSAAGHAVALQAAGTVNGAGVGTTAVTAAAITITAGTGIGNISPMETAVGNLSASVQSAGDLRIKNTSGGLSVSQAHTFDGDIHLEAVGAAANLTITDVVALGRTATLKAGAAVNGAEIATNAVTAATIDVTAGTGIGTFYPFEINAPNLSAAVQLAGDISIKDTAANLSVTLAQTFAGNIDLVAGGLVLTSVNAPGYTVSLESSAAVNGSAAGTAAIVANELSVLAATGIGTTGPLKIDAVTLDAVVDLAGTMQIKDLAGGLHVLLAQTANGNIGLEAAGIAADLLVRNVIAPGNSIILKAAGAVNGESFDGTADATAAGLAITAGMGIGTVNTLETSVTTLAFNNTGGQVKITNSAPLTIAATGGLTASANTGTTTTLTASGSLTFGMNTSSAGALTAMIADGAALSGGVDNIVVNAGAALTSVNSDVFLIAGDNVTINPGATLSANGTISISIDSGNNDPGAGGVATLGGTFSATSISVLGGSDDDFFVASADAKAEAFNGAGGFDTYRALGIEGDVVFTNSGITSAALGNDTFTSIERVDLAGGSGVNHFDATAFTGLAVLSGGGGRDVLFGADVIIQPLSFTLADVDGDVISAKFSRGELDFTNLRFEVNGSGIQLEAIDLLGNAAFQGASLTISVKHGLTGDGFANIGSINAAGVNLGNVKIAGDLGQITAGTGDVKKPAIDSLSVQSLGAFGSLSGAPSVETQIFGKLGKLLVKGDLVGATVNVLAGGIGAVQIGGDLIGGANDFSGAIRSAGPIGKVTIKGTMQGGTGAYAGSIVTSGNAEIGNVTVGAILGGFSAFNGIFSDGTLGPVKVLGSINGSEAFPATISAKGTMSPKNGGDAMAIKGLSVAGSVRFANVLAGYSTLGAGANADVEIGAVSVAGNWIASNLVAGVLANGNGFGTADDSVIGGGTGDLVSRIASITIQGTASGTAAAGDHFGFVAEQIGKFRLGATTFPTDPDAITLQPFNDLTLRRI